MQTYSVRYISDDDHVTQFRQNFNYLRQETDLFKHYASHFVCGIKKELPLGSFFLSPKCLTVERVLLGLSFF